MLGKPKYTYNDVVIFTIDNQDKCGIIAIVDKWGTFFDNSDVQYDIMVHEENMFYKHIPEGSIKRKIGVSEEELY